MTRRHQLQQRDRKRRELEESTEKGVEIARTVARARRLGLTVSTPVAASTDAPAQALSQPLPFEPYDASPQTVFTDPLPAYVDWKRFAYLGGPGRHAGSRPQRAARRVAGRGFATWLAQFVQVAGADVVVVRAPDPDRGAFGFAPLIAELARPPLPRQRALLRRELEKRLPPVIARQPGHQDRRHHTPAPLKGKPMWEINVTFARDIHGMDTVGIAVALGLDDYREDVVEERKINNVDGSRGGRRYVESGRARLSRLGAWPWCLRNDGQLPPRWYCEEEFATALATWHYQQALATLATTFIGAGAVARDTYRQWYTAWAQVPGLSQGTPPGNPEPGTPDGHLAENE
jgi:hypothetical protein